MSCREKLEEESKLAFLGLARAIFSVARGMKTSKALKWINFHAAATTFHPLTMTTAEDPLREISITNHFSSPNPPSEPHPSGSGEPGPDQEVDLENTTL